MGAFKKDPQNLERNEQRNGIEDANTKVSLILEGITDLLLVEEKASMAIPVAFYFALLLRSLSLNLIEDLKTKLHKEVVSVLHLG
jgi:NPH3 family